MKVVSVLLYTDQAPSCRSMADAFHIPASTLQHWIDHYKTHGPLSDIKQTNWPRKVDARGERELLQTVRAKPIIILGDLAVEKGISIDTARLHLRDRS